MELKSLGVKTDLFFNEFDGEVRDRGDYMVAKRPQSPNYFWGNFLIFPKPPKKGDLSRWKELFQKELSSHSKHHFSFAWDSPSGEQGNVQEFLENGFEIDDGLILTAKKVIRPSRFCEDAEVRPLLTDKEWKEATLIQHDAIEHDGAEDISIESYKNFYTEQMSLYRKLSERGLGHWFGAFLDGKVVAGLGLFWNHGVGRFQIVTTHPDYRRRGVCGRLVYDAAEYGFKKKGLQTLVMCADEDYHAAKIYESCGFQPTEKQIGICWWDKKHFGD